MGDKGIWAMLGIAPTSDQRAIRVAYAARLKAIDPDQDPGAFVALRDAYALAKAGAPSAVPTTPTFEPMPAEDFHARLAELAGLFEVAARSEHPWLSREAKARLRACWRGIVEDPGMEDVSFYGQAEREVAHLIARWDRLAVGLVIFATEFFGWATREIDVSTDDAVVEVVRRYRLVRFLQVVRKPVNAHHAAWVELTAKAYPGSRRGRCDPLLVHELLVIVREIWPELETEFDPLRVELWRENTADPDHLENRLAEQAQWQRWRIIGFVFLVLLALCHFAWRTAELLR